MSSLVISLENVFMDMIAAMLINLCVSQRMTVYRDGKLKETG